MSQPEAQQIVAQLPQKLAQAGLNINSIPPDKLLKIIEGTYTQVKSGKKFTPPPRPPQLGGAPMQTNPQQMAALSQAAQSNNK